MAGRRKAILDPSYEAVVVGAGNGGLGAALQLALKGVKTLLLEQHNVPGGFATSFVRGRFEFDASLHELADVGSADNAGSLRVFLDEAGTDIDWVAIPEAYRVILTDENLNVRVPFGIEELIDTIESEVPGSRKAMTKYMELCKDVNGALGILGGIADSAKPDRMISDFMSFVRDSDNPIEEIASIVRKLMNLLRVISKTVDQVSDEYKLPDRARAILYPYWCYLGLPMSRLSFTSWGAMLISYMTKGAYVPRMRSQELTMAMESRIRELGGRIEYNTRVEEILVERGKVTGVRTSQGDEIRTSQIIANVSPTLVYNDLISPKTEVPKIALKNVNARKHASSCIVVYMGLDTTLDELGLTDYGYFISKNMDTDEIYDSTYVLDVPIMQATTCLNNVIPDCSPPGTSIVSITTLFSMDSWSDVTPKDYFKVKNRIANGLIDQLENGTGANIRDHIEEIEVATPATFARYTRSYKGVVYGYELDPWDGVIARVVTKEDEKYIKGLEIGGGFSFMGHGYNVSLLSGRAAALSTLKEMGVKS